MSSAYLRLLILLPAILIPACASSGPAFRMLYAACRLHKQGDNIQPWGTPFPIWNHSVVPCPVLTVACTQISQEAGKVVWYSHLFKNFPQFVVIHTVKGFGGRQDENHNHRNFQYSCLGNPLADYSPWDSKQQTQLKRLGRHTCTWEARTPYIAK